MEPTTAIAPINKQAALSRPLDFSPEQTQLIRDTFANGANDGEFAVLMEIAKARNLNPLLRQVWFVQRWDGQKNRMVWAVQVSIDGLRTIAQRTGLYDGQDEPEFVYEAKRLVMARVKVYRKDWARPAVGVAHFDEYALKKKGGEFTSMWREKPHIMLAKCAEALALRKAFPEDTAGLYVAEEMPDKNDDDAGHAPRARRANQDSSTAAPAAPPPAATPPSGTSVETDEQKIERWTEAMKACESAKLFEECIAKMSGERLPVAVRTALSPLYLELKSKWLPDQRKGAKRAAAEKPQPGPCSICGEKEHGSQACPNSTAEERAEALRSEVTGPEAA